MRDLTTDSEKLNFYFDIYKQSKGQLITEENVETIKENYGISGFFRGKGAGNWIAAWGIAASAIAPLMSGGFPIWVTLLALVVGTGLWRELNFEAARHSFAFQQGIKNKKIDVFHKRLCTLLEEIDKETPDITADDKAKIIADFIGSQEYYRTIKSKFKPHDNTIDYIDEIVKNIKIMLHEEENNIVTNKLNELLDDSRKATKSNEINIEMYGLSRNYSSIQKVFAKQYSSYQNNKKYKDIIQLVKWSASTISINAAVLGSTLGCFVVGLSSAGFFASLLHLTTIPAYASLAFASLMGWGGYWSYMSNTGPTLERVFKDFLYQYLSESKNNETVTWNKRTRQILMGIGITCSIIMGIAIGTLNLEFGNFLVTVINHPYILTNPMALASLASTASPLGALIGWISFGLTALGTTAIFLKYLVMGIVNLVPEETENTNSDLVEASTNEGDTETLLKANESNEKPNNLNIGHTIFKAIAVLLFTFFSAYSVAYFVGLAFPAIKTAAMATIYVTGTIVYISQGKSIMDDFVENYGNWLGNSEGHKTKQEQIGLRTFEVKADELKDGHNTIYQTHINKRTNDDELSQTTTQTL